MGTSVPPSPNCPHTSPLFAPDALCPGYGWMFGLRWTGAWREIIVGMWWFYTVILGIAFGRVLQELAIGLRDWRHGKRRPFAPAMLWQVFLLALSIQVWLAVPQAVRSDEISVLGLLAYLAVPSGILVMSFLLPHSDLGPQDDPEEAFGRVRPLFFGVLIAVVAINLLHTFLIGQRGVDVDLLFQVLMVTGALVGLSLRRRAADSALAAAMILVVLSYTGLEYSTVQVKGRDAAAASVALNIAVSAK